MSQLQSGHLIYLLILLAVLVFWTARSHRHALRHMLRNATVWAVIIAGVAIGAGLWNDIQRQTPFRNAATVTEGGQIELPRAFDGHYYATLDINGAPVQFLVDTGATNMVLTARDAERAGLAQEDLSFISSAMTANGRVRTAPVRLQDVQFGPYRDRNVRAFVNEGAMDQSLLGMDYLQRYSHIAISNGTLVLER